MALATLFHDVEEIFRRPSGLTLAETEGAFVIEALVAGVKAKDISISFEKGSLRIEAKSEKYAYSYLIPLPVGQVDEQGASEAVAEEGILKVTLPKMKAPKPLKITVKGA